MATDNWEYLPGYLPGRSPSELKQSALYTLPAHGQAYTDQLFQEGVSYISSNMIYVIVFILFTLAIYWTAGGKPTFYFLLIVLLGQLLTNTKELTEILKKKG